LLMYSHLNPLYAYPDLLSFRTFPTRRSSDLDTDELRQQRRAVRVVLGGHDHRAVGGQRQRAPPHQGRPEFRRARRQSHRALSARSEEHTSELQSREKLVCRLLLEKKNEHEET